MLIGFSVTVVVPVFVGSATLRAVMMALPVLAEVGAVKTPEASMVPAEASQVTEVLAIVPVTVALKAWVPP
jgi:hypothetical protein